MRRVLLSLLGLVLLLVIGAPVALLLALRSESGSDWLLQKVPGLTVTNPRGSLLGDFSADRVELALPPDGRLILTEPSWQGLRVSRSPISGQWAAVHVDRLQARTAELIPATPPEEEPPKKPPADLKLPVALRIDALSLGEFRTAALGDKPVRDLRGRMDLSADAGERHRIELTNLDWDRLRARGRLEVGTRGDMVLDGRLDLVPSPGGTTASAAPAGTSGSAAAATASALDNWAASVALSGPLTRPSVNARASASGKQLLNANAVLQPFEPWPLADLSATTDGLDLALFSSAAPKTSLSGDAQVESQGLDKPARIQLQLSNAAAGAWNAQLLPLRSLQLDVQARPDAPQVATIRRFEALLGSQAQPAGQITGSGSYDQGRFEVKAVLDQLLPARLDARAPVVSLSGPLTVSGELPASQAAAASAPRAASAPGGSADGAGVTRLAVVSRLSGRIETPGAAPPARTAAPRGSTPGARARAAAASQPLAIDVELATRLGPAGALSLTIDRALLESGDAGLRLEGSVERADAAAATLVDARASLQRFDPGPWVMAPANAAWRSGANRINAAVDADLQLLPAATTATSKPPRSTAPAAGNPLDTVYAQLAQLRGTVAVKVEPSVVAGLALEGKAGLKVEGAAPGPGIAQADLALRSGSNRVEAALRTRADRPAADRLELTVDAPRLGELASLARQFGLSAAGGNPGGTSAGAGARTLGGSIVGTAQVTGRWPAVRTEGQLQANAVQLPELRLHSGDVDWRLGTSADSPLALKAELTGLAVAGASVDRAQVDLSGTAREHRLDLTAESQVLPPEWTDKLTGAKPVKAGATRRPVTAGTAPSSVRLRASGGLLDATGVSARGAAPSASGWRGRIDELRLRSGTDPSSAIVVRTNDLALAARWAGAAPSLAVQPGRVELQAGPTVAALRWSRIELQGGVPATPGRAATAPRVDVVAELEPIAVTPLLARFQPDFGWGGDLRIGGRFEMRSTPAVRADVVIERRGGDLSVTDELGTVQQLGLTDLRLALDARDGVWNFTQAVAGSRLGVGAGSIVARTGSPTAWPDAKTPVQGVVELRVESLGTWGSWLPTGWRMGGNLLASASIGGRLGAPEFTGLLRGNDISVRNFVEGVNVTDGRIAVTLKGETARIETFTARGGSGTVSLTGDATFGASPRATLSMVADDFQLLGRVDRRVVASGQGRLRLAAERIALDGRFTVDEGLIDFTRGGAPSLSDDVTVVRAERSPDGRVVEVKARSGDEKPVPKEPQKPSAAARALTLDLRVDLGNDLRLKGRGLNTGLRGELHITSPGGRLAVNGTVRTHDGTFKAYGQDLKIERGTVTFIGAVDNPRLDITAIRAGLDDRVGVMVGGNVSNLRVRLFSEPEMSEIDKLALLVLGRRTEGLGRAETALMQRAALALLSGEGESTTDKVTKALGLDEFALRQGEDGDLRSTVVTVGKQLSDRVYVGYERGLNATSGNWQLIYRVAQRFTLRASAGFENALDLIWTWRWQ